MRAVTVRDLDPRRHAYVEARLIVNENNVWRLGRRCARRLERPQAIAGKCRRLHQATRHEFGNGVDARAGERRDQVPAVESFERRHRKQHFERAQSAKANDDERNCNRAAHAEWIEPPNGHGDKQKHEQAKRNDQRSAGKTVNRKLIVSVSTIIRSTKFAVIIKTWYLSCDSRTSTAIMESDSTLARTGRRVSASQKKFRMPQASAKAAMAVAVASVASMMASAATCGNSASAGRPKPRRTISLAVAMG